MSIWISKEKLGLKEGTMKVPPEVTQGTSGDGERPEDRKEGGPVKGPRRSSREAGGGQKPRERSFSKGCEGSRVDAAVTVCGCLPRLGQELLGHWRPHPEQCGGHSRALAGTVERLRGEEAGGAGVCCAGPGSGQAVGEDSQ